MKHSRSNEKYSKIKLNIFKWCMNVCLTLLGLLVEVSLSQWLFCGLRSVCHFAPWSKVITVSIAPSAVNNIHFSSGSTWVHNYPTTFSKTFSQSVDSYLAFYVATVLSLYYYGERMKNLLNQPIENLFGINGSEHLVDFILNDKV